MLPRANPIREALFGKKIYFLADHVVIHPLAQDGQSIGMMLGEELKKNGAHLVSYSGNPTFHRAILTQEVADAAWEQIQKEKPDAVVIFAAGIDFEHSDTLGHKPALSLTRKCQKAGIKVMVTENAAIPMRQRLVFGQRPDNLALSERASPQDIVYELGTFLGAAQGIKRC